MTALLTFLPPLRSPSFTLPLPESGSGVVYVAVGKSVHNSLSLLRWTFNTFPGREICLLHVHRPSPLIPTLLGKLPASQANPETVAAYRHEEREETKRLLHSYMMACHRLRVSVSIITTEADDIEKGIVDLVNQHMIRKLVIEATPHFLKRKKSSCKTCHAARYSPLYCEISFVKKGKLIWTKQASASSDIDLPNPRLATDSAQSLRSWSFDSGPKEGASETEDSCIQLPDLIREVAETKDETYLLLLDQKQLEAEALEAFDKVKVLEMAQSHELILRMAAEDELTAVLQEQDKLLEERKELNQQLQKAMRSIALLDSRAHESNHRSQEIATELELIHTSLAMLHEEKLKLQRQKVEAVRWLDRWRGHQHCENGNDNNLNGLAEVNPEVPEFLLSELEAATCDFSESFKIGRGGYGVVYKGELLDQTVAIKKLHSHDMQGQTEFHKVVEVLSKLQHPNLVKFIGACPESWLLVYEYLPRGGLQNYLFKSHNITALSWKTRAQIVADIASGLLFLHSVKKIVHGNLKPSNLLLDSQNRCKVSDYGDHMLTLNQALRCPSFRRCSGSIGSFSYTDPEYHRTGTRTHKSDIYSFGIIILQLITGKAEGRLVAKVSQSLSNGKLASVLDSSAGEWSTYVARRLLEMGLQFCELNSRDRPELTPSLVKELRHLPFLEDQIVPSLFICPIFGEIMHNPMVAADGFTYEGEALRGWLENGHDTSPMTNLKLSHLNLIPNHTLRLAIQEWLMNLKIAS